MTRHFAGILLCLAPIALHIQGAAAADATACGLTGAVGLSMPERHAAIKAGAEARIGQLSTRNALDVLHCQTGVTLTVSDEDLPVWRDARQPGDAPYRQGAGCVACATGAMMLPGIATRS